VDKQKRFSFRDGHADAARVDAVAIENRECFIAQFGGNGHQ
jgi:hypothetical protein